MQVQARRGDARERLLNAAATLLVERGADEVSTRAICDAAGVQAPTLYHHFGSKQGLLDAVVNHGFEQYLARKRAHPSSGDPIADIRAGWDDHVAFGLENPAFYALMWGDITPGHRPPAAGEAERILLGLFTTAAQQDRLVVDPDDATTQYLSAVVGMTLFLLTQESPTRAHRASAGRLRDTLLAEFTGAEPEQRSDATENEVGTAARRLSRAVRRDSGPLDRREVAMLRWWLDRLVESDRR